MPILSEQHILEETQQQEADSAVDAREAEAAVHLVGQLAIHVIRESDPEAKLEVIHADSEIKDALRRAESAGARIAVIADQLDLSAAFSAIYRVFGSSAGPKLDHLHNIAVTLGGSRANREAAIPWLKFMGFSVDDVGGDYTRAGLIGLALTGALIEYQTTGRTGPGLRDLLARWGLPEVPIRLRYVDDVITRPNGGNGRITRTVSRLVSALSAQGFGATWSGKESNPVVSLTL